MKNGKFTTTILRMQYVPRWSEFAPRFEDNAASHSFRCAAISILAGLVEEKLFHRPIDKLQLLGRSLWCDLNNTGTGSIKHVTKKEHLVAHHIRHHEHEISKEIVSYLSRSLQPKAADFITNAKDNTYVGRLVDEIDTFDAYLFCHRESRFGSNPYFSDKCDELYKLLQTSASDSIQWLLREFDKREGIYTFLEYIVNLDTVKRWNGNFNFIPDNDSTHSFRVASIALLNGLLEKERFGNDSLDLYKTVAKATLHDLPEVLCGDVTANFKHNNPEIKHAFETYEKSTAYDMIGHLPEPVRADFVECMAECKSADAEGEMVDIADKLDALIKCNLEMRNNPHYVDTYYQQLLTIQHKYENPCVIFFLAYILHDLTFANLIK